jgi:hypothetical protein
MSDTTDLPQPEPDDAGCEAVPADLVELHEVLEWEAAVRARAAEAID